MRAAKKLATARASSAQTQRPWRPPFHTYGRANTSPTSGGFVYGDYLATHNARAGSTPSMSEQQPTHHETQRPQTHFTETDLRALGADPTETAAPKPPGSASRRSLMVSPRTLQQAPLSATSIDATTDPAHGATAETGPSDAASRAAPTPNAPPAPIIIPMPWLGDSPAARYDPRMYKFAPHLLPSVPAAGQRMLRADNLGPL